MPQGRRLRPGKAVITKGFGLPAKYIIHAVGPVWHGGGHGEEKILYSAYMESMKLAKEKKLSSIAFPLLSSGHCGCPKERALQTAISAISDFLMENDMLVYLVIYDTASFAVSQKLFSSIEEYIDEHYIAQHMEEICFMNETQRIPDMQPPPASQNRFFKKKRGREAPAAAASMSPAEKTRVLDGIMAHMGESFSQMLLRLIDERGLTDPEVYHRANIDRKLFSKIRTNPGYSPKKKTVMAFAFALELSLDETKDLLGSAGYSLSDSSRYDIILRFFLERKIYDIFEINEMLFYYGQPLLGG